MFRKLAIVVLFMFSFSLNADVIKWVDSEGKTHYSNKAPKKNKKASQKMKFIKYKKPSKSSEIQPFVIVEKLEGVSETQKLKKTKTKKTKNKKLTITELKVRCELAREKRLKPVRDEEIEKCVVKREPHISKPREYCERVNRYFGNGERSGYGRTLRLFHDIPECRRLYKAEDKRSRLIRGYRN